MSTFTPNAVQSNTRDPRPLLRPLFHVLRPNNLCVPLIPADELPSWLEVVSTYTIDVNHSFLASYTPHPRLGEYDIICRYCETATQHIHDWNPWSANGLEEQSRIALRTHVSAGAGGYAAANGVMACTVHEEVVTCVFDADAAGVAVVADASIASTDTTATIPTAALFTAVWQTVSTLLTPLSAAKSTAGCATGSRKIRATSTDEQARRSGFRATA
ncbi:hypothetical protein TSTA_004290 [Talaromyces stipitatus ATCC 10500]|uniref:Uncharacterized protein n=1 Tax=Talaromyces stipitatus (strain ATCC 10500 / CBS 375.48 / QM 6759 / NRRL 1006) TaxID=441959 RepID=B8MTD1_TALSN|nr:uncharacterized protein TSTA_004290 [Talaromyces stipitatus ATCC 10500]EED12380.1 hypothetical protein TSTA_004290 [Talaromyces stipitatus ATCC 10500]